MSTLTVACGIAAANFVAGSLALLLPETCGVSLGGEDGAAAGEAATLKGGKGDGKTYGTTA